MHHRLSSIGRIAALVLAALAISRGETIADLPKEMQRLATEVHHFSRSAFLLAQIDSLPKFDRAWTRSFVLCPGSHWDSALADGNCVRKAKATPTCSRFHQSDVSC